MKKEYFCYGLCGAIAFRGIILPDWPSTIALMFAVTLCGFWMWLDFRAVDKNKDAELLSVKQDISKLSEKMGIMAIKLGFKK